MRKKYGDKAELLFMDTDSLMYEIETEDFFEDIKMDVESKFDTSDVRLVRVGFKDATRK